MSYNNGIVFVCRKHGQTKEIFGHDFDKPHNIKDFVPQIPENARAQYLNIYTTNQTSI